VEYLTFVTMYCWGKNNALQLSLPISDKNKPHANKPKRVGVGKHFVKAAWGENHGVFLDRYGYVWSSGRNCEGQCGRGIVAAAGASATGLLERVNSGSLCQERVMDVAAGSNATYAVTASGRVFAWGFLPVRVDEVGNAIDHEDYDVGKMVTAPSPAPERPTYLQRVLRASASAYLMNDPSLFNNPENRANEGIQSMGTIKRKKFSEPILVPFPSVSVKIQKIVCGASHAVALGVAGECYSRGYNDRGQLGTGTRVHSSKFTCIKQTEHFQRVVDIAAGSQHNLFLCQEGTVFTCGSGALGQLGVGPSVADRLLPTQVKFFDFFRDMKTGDDREALPGQGVLIAAGQFHSVVVFDNSIYSWGMSEYEIHNINGDSSRHAYPRYYFTPRELSVHEGYLRNRNIIDVKATAHSTLLLLSDGTVHTWGWHSYGILGSGPGHGVLGIRQVSGLVGIEGITAGEYNVACFCTSQSHDYGLTFRPMLKDERFADIHLTVNGADVYHLHLFVLAKRAPHFLDLHYHGQRAIDIHCSRRDAIAYAAFFEYVYTDQCKIQRHLKHNLAALAHTYKVEVLFVRCTDQSAVSIVDDNETHSILAGNRQQLLASIVQFGKGTGGRLTPVSHRKWTGSRVTTSTKSGLAAAQNTKPATVPGKIINKNTAKSSFVSDFQSMLIARDDKHDFDIFFSCPRREDGEGENRERTTERMLLGAHRAILSRIPYFRSMLFGGFAESSCLSAGILVDCPGDIFQHVLQWIYSGDTNIVDGANATELLAFAKEKGMDDLMMCAEVFVFENMSIDNANDIADFATSFDFPRLKAEAMVIIHSAVPSTAGKDEVKP